MKPWLLNYGAYESHTRILQDMQYTQVASKSTLYFYTVTDAHDTSLWARSYAVKQQCSNQNEVSSSAYASIHITVNVIREQLYKVVEKSSGNHALKLTNLWHVYPKWHTGRFPRPIIFTTAPIFFIYFPHPASQYCERYVCVCVCVCVYTRSVQKVSSHI